jgi:CubicO group peptidase (beta-lactamase class C family)
MGSVRASALWLTVLLAALPLLGRLVEVLSNLLIDRYLEQRLFQPLDREDTGFHLAESKPNRVAVLYVAIEDGSRTRRLWNNLASEEHRWPVSPW